MYVKDYQGKLIEKTKARKIKGEGGVSQYYEIGVSCILMSDGQWYRTNTGKILFDHSHNKWVHQSEFKGLRGIVKGGENGAFSNLADIVVILDKVSKPTRTQSMELSTGQVISEESLAKGWTHRTCINTEVALSLGYIEAISDGKFYKKDDITPVELKRFNTPTTPQNERNNVYSLDDDKEYRAHLEAAYDGNEIKVNRDLEIIARRYIPFSYGLEIETQVGFIPTRVRERLGFRTCRDGSLDGGLEFVSIPMEGGKGLQVVKRICDELTARTTISNKCSVHVHFGDVRKDRLYIVSYWHLLTKIQDEFRHYFPYSRTNSIREDGKVYAALLPDLELDLKNILSIKGDDAFKNKVTTEFTKIYSWLNSGHPPGEVFDEQFIKDTRESLIKGKTQKQYCYRVKKFNYTTKLPRHAIQGHKWQRPTRYLFCNFLNLFFAHSNTLEMRIHEATTNFDKILHYMLLCVAILKYAEKFSLVFSTNKTTIKEILEDYYPKELSSQLLEYYEGRKETFCNSTGGFKSGWKVLEEKLFNDDKNYKKAIKII